MASVSPEGTPAEPGSPEPDGGSARLGDRSTDRPAGWYQDPDNPGKGRYWDGTHWQRGPEDSLRQSDSPDPAQDADAVSSPVSKYPAGWYPDARVGGERHRYWNGTGWQDETSALPTQPSRPQFFRIPPQTDWVIYAGLATALLYVVARNSGDTYRPGTAGFVAALIDIGIDFIFISPILIGLIALVRYLIRLARRRTERPSRPQGANTLYWTVALIASVIIAFTIIGFAAATLSGQGKANSSGGTRDACSYFLDEYVNMARVAASETSPTVAVQEMVATLNRMATEVTDPYISEKLTLMSRNVSSKTSNSEPGTDILAYCLSTGGATEADIQGWANRLKPYMQN